MNRDLNSKIMRAFLYRPLFAAIICVFISSFSFGQNLLYSRHSGYYTYIYRITNDEAKNIYKNDLYITDRSYFHTLADSFPSDSEYTRQLPPGHYLRTGLVENKQSVSITTVRSFDVFIQNNTSDLCVQVTDLNGKPIPDAIVKVHHKKLKYDAHKKVFTDKKSNRQGVLEVTVGANTQYYHLDREFNNSAVRRTYLTVFYRTPLRYVWVPVRYFVFLPIDGVRSIVKGWAVGSIRQTKYWYAVINEGMYYAWQKIKHPRRFHHYKENVNGYIVFDKPQYRPGDTVHVKSYLTNRHGKPLQKELIIFLRNSGKEHKIQTMQSHRKGAYTSTFVLHDSLQLRLTDVCNIELRDKKAAIYKASEFDYHDYELKRNSLRVDCAQKKQYRGNPLTLKIKATDDNGLNLQDARVEIVAHATSVREYFKPAVFVPDTLIYLKQTLNPQGETEILLNDSIFPAADFTYEITVDVRTSDNELNTEKIKIKYYNSPGQAEISLQNDSLNIRYIEDGLSVSHHATVTATDAFNFKTIVYEGDIPCTLPLNPRMKKYSVVAGSSKSELDISEEEAGLICYGTRQNDSLKLSVYNPSNIEFTWDLYCRNRRIQSGSGKQLQLNMKDVSKGNYFISINYIWAGEVKNESRQLRLMDRNLNVTMLQPAVVYPGQKTTIAVNVTDHRGKPVKDVDLTAWSVTKKFNKKGPEISYYGKFRKPKRLINSFDFNTHSISERKEGTADYAFWRDKAAIDTMLYYQFRYPGDSIFRFEYPLQDSITQFAPFVFSNGYNIPVHVIYVDNSPVYFSWTNHIQPYSFRIDRGFHQIVLRTEKSWITIDSMYFSEGQKLIFSVDKSLNNAQVHNVEMPFDLTSSEKLYLYPYIIPVQNNFTSGFAWMKANDRIQLLATQNTRRTLLLAGPVSGQVELIVPGNYQHTFIHEAQFEYEFAKNLIKMRSAGSRLYPDQLWKYNCENSLRDAVLTEKMMQDMWISQQERKQFDSLKFQERAMALSLSGLLQISYEYHYVKSPLCCVLQNLNDTALTSVYPGGAYQFNNLAPGLYRLTIVFPDRKYLIADSIRIKANGINHYQINPFLLLNDTVQYRQIFKLIKRFSEKNLAQLKQTSMSFENNSNTNCTGNACGSLRGQVSDAESGEPVPFCNVYIKMADDKLIGAQTDFDGYYLIKPIPPGNYNVTFSSIGYDKLIMQDVRIFSNNTQLLDAQLEPGKSLQACEIMCYNPNYEVTTVNRLCSVESISIMPGRDASSISVQVGGVSSDLNIDYEKLSDGSVLASVFSWDGLMGSIRGDNTSVYINGAKAVGNQTIPEGAMIIVDGYAFTGDFAALDQLQVMRIDILTAEQATAKYGDEGKNGVVEILTMQKNPAGDTERGAWYDAEFLTEAEKSGSVRSHFSDVGFWQPELVTDKNGHAEFEVVFPDDVTCWKTYCLAMNNKRQTGQTSDSIKSYKPLMAQLFVPLFLTQGDTSDVIGKMLNYAPDSVSVSRFFETDNIKTDLGRTVCANAITDTMTVVAADSLKIKYQLLRDDGYFDGEVRGIPVYKQGLERASGNFYVLNKDTTIRISTDSMQTVTTLYASADELDIMNIEISKIIYYRYDCNEQMASKLKAMLAEKRIAEFKGTKFTHDREVNKLIDKMSQNRNKSELWGWWNDSETNVWMSLHVLEAFIEAQKQGYKIPDTGTSVAMLIRQIENTGDFATQVRILNLLASLKTTYNYKQWLTAGNTDSLTLKERLELASLQQKLRIPFSMDSLLRYQKTTLSGNIYFSDSTRETVDNSDVQNTLRMYRILKADPENHPKMLQQMRNYFFEKRMAGAWQNTYESVQIISTLLPDMLDSNRVVAKPALQLSGDTSITVTQFPFSMSLKPGMQLNVTKSGAFPVYMTTYNMHHEKRPEKRENDFVITTFFENDTAGILSAGRETILCARVEVKKEAEYVMINVPVPGGCSYASKNKNVRYETHREYFRNETAIFCEHLPAGTYTFKISILPRYSGSYTLNPASISLMYFPVFNANNELKKVRVK